MWQDMLTVMWKERRGILKVQGSRGRFLLTMTSPLFLGIIFPLQMGEDWLTKSFPVILAGVVALIVVGITIPESFAGERERHTLETLLASRLPDEAILFGKYLVSVSLSFGLTLAIMLLSAVVVNIKIWNGSVQFYSLPVLLGQLVINLLFGTLIAGLGVIISQHADTVQEASQRLMAGFLVAPLILQVVIFAGGRDMFLRLETLDGVRLLIGTIMVLSVASAVMGVLAWRSFRRSRLIA